MNIQALFQTNCYVPVSSHVLLFCPETARSQCVVHPLGEEFKPCLAAVLEQSYLFASFLNALSCYVEIH